MLERIPAVASAQATTGGLRADRPASSALARARGDGRPIARGTVASAARAGASRRRALGAVTEPLEGSPGRPRREPGGPAPIRRETSMLRARDDIRVPCEHKRNEMPPALAGLPDELRFLHQQFAWEVEEIAQLTKAVRIGFATPAEVAGQVHDCALRQGRLEDEMLRWVAENMVLRTKAR